MKVEETCSKPPKVKGITVDLHNWEKNNPMHLEELQASLLLDLLQFK